MAGSTISGAEPLGTAITALVITQIPLTKMQFMHLKTYTVDQLQFTQLNNLICMSSVHFWEFGKML
jgi:hypothetical protein